MKNKSMEQEIQNDDYELRPEYDFSKLKKVSQGVYKKFRAAKAVNCSA